MSVICYTIIVCLRGENEWNCIIMNFFKVYSIYSPIWIFFFFWKFNSEKWNYYEGRWAFLQKSGGTLIPFLRREKKGRKWMNSIIVKLYIISFPFFLYELPNTLEKIHHVFHSIPFLRKRLPNTVLIEWCQCCVLFIFLTL